MTWRARAIRCIVRTLMLIFLHAFYRIRLYDRDRIPRQGGGLLVSNHLTWLDGFLVMFAARRPVRMIVYQGNFTIGWTRAIADAFGCIQITANPKSIARGLRLAAAVAADGQLVGIFPEGGISRSGHLHTFRAGFMRVLRDASTPVIPLYLDELWGSLFSFEGGRFFWKKPKRWRYPISIHVGRPLVGPKSAFEVRRVVQHLGSEAVIEKRDRKMNLLRRSIRALKKRTLRSKVADSLGIDVSGKQLLMRVVILCRLLRRFTWEPTEKRVGILLPPSCGGVLANLAVTLEQRTAVNLNYTLSAEALAHCVSTAGIRHVLTSRKVHDKLNLDLDVEWVFLDELRDQVRWSDKIAGAVTGYLLPSFVVDRIFGLHRLSPDNEMAIMFTSGSTGMPKGVVLSLHNVGSNVQAIQDVVNLRDTDVLIGILPFFHAFGFTVTLWGVLGLDIKGIYHISPLESKQIGKLSRRHHGTILISTPTFLRSLIQRCEPEDFAHVDVAVAGAEKLPKQLMDAFEKKFGVRPVEGYGATELSPLVSVNVPVSRTFSDEQVVRREGSVGKPVPGVSARITNVDTGEELGAGEVGMLWIAGPNVMRGYLHQPEATQAVISDGWYKTGDLGYVDEDGFVFITGRESRFSKIGGEMVPHGLVEEELQRIVGQQPDDPPQVAVTAVPDQKKGERLVVVHVPLELSPETLCKRLREAGLANIFVPGVNAFVQVDAIPTLGSGKVDLKALRDIAQERCGAK